MADLTTPSPYLRDGLLGLVEQLRQHAAQAAQAYEDAAAERNRLAAELADAEDHAKACAAELDVIAESIRWAETEAARRTAEIDAATAAHHAGIGTAEPPQAALPEDACAYLGCTSCLGCDGCTCHAPDGDELPFNVVSAPADVIAALTGGTPTVSPDAPPGQVVATHGPGETGPLDPTVTAPDAGLAHPVPNPPGPPPQNGPDGPRHAKPGLLDRLTHRTGGHPIIRDEQTGEA